MKMTFILRYLMGGGFKSGSSSHDCLIELEMNLLKESFGNDCIKAGRNVVDSMAGREIKRFDHILHDLLVLAYFYYSNHKIKNLCIGLC